VIEVIPVAQRRERAAALIQKVVSELLARRVKDPRIGFASIIGVEVTKDIAFAKVHVSVLGSTEEKAKTMEGLRSAQGLIRSEVARALGTRHAPELEFILNEGIEHSIRVSKLLQDIKKEDGERSE
jgi:ribosome-binding factor A